MGGCCGKKVADEGAPPPLDVEKVDRKCTDLLFLLLFIAFWVGMVGIAAVGIAMGEPERLIYASDYEGTTCGGADKPDQKYIYYPKITEDIIDNMNAGISSPTEYKLFGICLDECPVPIGDDETPPVVCTYAAEKKLSKTDYGTGGAKPTADERLSKWNDCQSWTALTNDCPTIRDECWIVPLETQSYFFRCLWLREASANETVVCEYPRPCLQAGDASCVDVSSDEDAVCYNEESGELGTCTDFAVAGELPVGIKYGIYNVGQKTWLSKSSLVDQCITKTTLSVGQTKEGAQDNPLMDQLYDTGELVARYVSDVDRTKLTIFTCGLLVALVMGFVYLFVIKWFVGCIVWTIVIGVIIALFLFTIFCYFKAGLLDQSVVDSVNNVASKGTEKELVVPEQAQQADADMQEKWSYVAYIMTAISILVFLLIVAMRKRIKLAIAIMKEASNAVKTMPLIVLFPFTTVALVVVLCLYWIIIAAYIASAGEESSSKLAADLDCDADASAGSNTSCPVDLTAFSSSTTMRYMLAYHFFGLLWTNQFIQAIGMCTLAGAISAWYWAEVDDKGKKKMSKAPVFKSWWRTIRYHIGSMAFGALIVAIVQFLRAVLMYLDKKTAEMQKKNALIKFLFKCIGCCLWCLEKCLKFINKNAYIFIAMKGSSFCKAAKDAFMTILSNAARVGVLNTISAFVILLGKIFIVVCSTIVAFLWFDKAPQFQAGGEDELNGMAFPLVLVVILAFGTAQAFLSVYDMAIETILLCFCEDEERAAKGAEMMAPESLLKAINAADKKKKKKKGTSSGEEEKSDGELL
jgi:choline transporter-like protein 2/4/5